MEIMFESVINNLNIPYIFMCNIVTYLVIKSIPKDPSTIWKRIISTVVAILLGAAGILWMNYDKEAVFCSFFVQFLMYDYVIKWFINKYGTSHDTDMDEVSGNKTNEQ